MKRFFRALMYSFYLVSVFLLVSFVWNTYQIGFEHTVENLVENLDAFLLYWILLAIVFWGTYELKFRIRKD